MLERSEGLAYQTEHHLQEIQGIRPRVSGCSSDQSTQLGHLSHVDSHYCCRRQRTTIPFSVDFMDKLCFYFSTIYRICIFSDGFYFDSTLIL
jgi:hypothetical protein